MATFMRDVLDETNPYVCRAVETYQAYFTTARNTPEENEKLQEHYRAVHEARQAGWCITDIRRIPERVQVGMGEWRWVDRYYAMGYPPGWQEEQH